MPEPSSKPASPKRQSTDLASGIVNVLKQELSAGIHPPDILFTELALSERFGVSRTPVREALLRLERDGLLVPRERSYGLPHYSIQQMADLFDVRLQLEPYLFKRIAQTGTQKEIDAIVRWAKKLMSDQDGTTAPSDTQSYIQVHQQIRAALLQLCRNPFIRNAVEMFDYQTAFVRQQTLRNTDNQRLSAQLTHQLLDALASRDAEATEAASRAALEAAYKVIRQQLQTED